MTNKKKLHNIAFKLRELRNKHNLSQEKLATELEITQGAYNHIENGKTLPNIEQLQVLADLYKTTISELVGEQTYLVIQENQNSPNSKAASNMTITEVQNEKLEKIAYSKR